MTCAEYPMVKGLKILVSFGLTLEFAGLPEQFNLKQKFAAFLATKCRCLPSK
jgi:hypothetical protein